LATERVERKLAAILAADVAGYSRLMGADEEGTLAQLKALELEHLRPGAACDIAQPPLATRCRQNLIKLDREALF